MILKEKKNFCQKNKIKFFNGYPCKNFTKYFCIHIILFQNILSIFLMCSLSKKTLFSSSKETKIYDPLRSGGGGGSTTKKTLILFLSPPTDWLFGVRPFETFTIAFQVHNSKVSPYSGNKSFE